MYRTPIRATRTVPPSPVALRAPLGTARRWPIQAKLAVGCPGDRYEQEAERVADRIVRMPATSPAAGAATAVGRTGLPGTTPDTPQFGPGRPLDGETRAYFEPRLGHDFSRVRVHADRSAHGLAHRLDANAFTLGSDVVFGAGQYAPHTAVGRRLLAHELTHVVQQQAAAHSVVQRDKKPEAAEDWDFTPADYAALRQAGKDLKIAAGSGWLPAKLQENILSTLRYTLDPKRSPAATEGINVKDFYHGHLVIPRAEGLTTEAQEKRTKFEEKEEKLTSAALGGKYKPVTEENVAAYTRAIKKTLPAFGAALAEGLKAKGAAVIYHTFEYKTPSDLAAAGKGLKPGDPRRNYITPLDTNAPAPYSPPDIGNASSYGQDYIAYLQFAFLVDRDGVVHVRPGSVTQLSSVTGTPMK